MNNLKISAIVGVAVLAVGITFGNLLSDATNTLINSINPPKMIDSIDELPDFNENQDYSQKEFSPLVRLEAMDGHFFCSGTVISKDYVLTAAHCIDDRNGHLAKKTIRVVSLTNKDGNQAVVEAIPASKNSRADYGLVKGDFSKFTNAMISHSPASILNLQGPILACGFPWGSENICYAVDQLSMYYNFISAHGIMFPGMSGGPVVDKGTMLIIAVNSGITPNSVILSPLVGLFETLGVKVIKVQE